MTPDPLTLAQRLVVCPRFRWMEGMLTIPGTLGNRAARVLAVDDRGIPVEWALPPSDAHRHEIHSGYGTPGWCEDAWWLALPDLTDPATLGCVCHLAGVWTDDVEALVAALEAAVDHPGDQTA